MLPGLASGHFNSFEENTSHFQPYKNMYAGQMRWYIMIFTDFESLLLLDPSDLLKTQL